MKNLVLYSTDHCSLCDEALELLLSMPELSGHSVRVVDVAIDDTLLQRYGPRVPVLVCATECARSETPGSDPAEFFAPFERDRLSAWLAGLK